MWELRCTAHILLAIWVTQQLPSATAVVFLICAEVLAVDYAIHNGD